MYVLYVGKYKLVKMYNMNNVCTCQVTRQRLVECIAIGLLIRREALHVGVGYEIDDRLKGRLDDRLLDAQQRSGCFALPSHIQAAQVSAKWFSDKYTHIHIHTYIHPYPYSIYTVIINLRFSNDSHTVHTYVMQIIIWKFILRIFIIYNILKNL